MPLAPSPAALRALSALTRRSFTSHPTPTICTRCRAARTPPIHRGTRRYQSSNTTPANTAPSKAELPKKPYYVTTPIFYVNAAPHIGHLYSAVTADIFKRFALLQGRDARLTTGTDEHGQKVSLAAVKAGVDDTLQFCNAGSDVFKHLADRAGVEYSTFIRTTESRHRDAVQYVWHLLEERGLIYRAKHEGWYSVSDEAFYPASAVKRIIEPWSGRKITVSTETGKEVEWQSEMNYHFRLSTMQQPLLEWYAANPNWIQPRFRHDEVVNHVKAGLSDLSISRPASRLSWGIPVPTDESQTIYVWLDALINYITAAGYPWSPGAESVGGWPADVQVIGKDIVRFHCVYWPAFLLALDLPLPRQIVAHAHWTLGKRKMAKSTGNVVNPHYALDRFGVDVMRFYLALDGSINEDADYETSFVIERYRSILQNALGNLVSRFTRTTIWDIATTVAGQYQTFDPTPYPGHCDELSRLPSEVLQKVDEGNVGAALRKIVDMIDRTNSFMQNQKPWHTAREVGNIPHSKVSEDRQNDEARRKSLQRQLDGTVFLIAESLRICGILLQPYLINKAGELLDMLGVDAGRRTVEFARMGADGNYGRPDAYVEREKTIGGKKKWLLFEELVSYV